MQVIIVILVGLLWWFLSARYDLLNKTIEILEKWKNQLNEYKKKLD